MNEPHQQGGGARYRYYISQAVLQNKRQTPGSIGRVPAAEIEALVIDALRRHLEASGTAVPTAPTETRARRGSLVLTVRPATGGAGKYEA